MITVEEVAALVGGVVRGEVTTPLLGAAPIRDVKDGEITLADDPKFLSKLEVCPAAAVIVCESFPEVHIPSIVVSDVHEAFSKVVRHFSPEVPPSFSGIHPTACIAESAKLGANCSVGPGAVVGDDVVIGDHCRIDAGSVIETACKIGDRTHVFPRCTFYAKTEIGSDCLIHAGVVLGAYGFGYNSKADGHHLSGQLGNVVVGDRVEIGANSTIDRGTYNSTVIGDGTKIDNLVMIGHNCRLGKNNLLCSQVGVAGSCRTGDGVVLAGQVGIGDHVDIGSGTTLGAKSGVMSNVPENSVYLGAPAVPIRQQMKTYAIIGKIGQWYSKWKDMLKRIEDLEGSLQKDLQEESPDVFPITDATSSSSDSVQVQKRKSA